MDAHQNIKSLNDNTSFTDQLNLNTNLAQPINQTLVIINELIETLLIDEINNLEEVKFIRNQDSNKIELYWRNYQYSLNLILEVINFKSLTISSTLIDQYAEKIMIPKLNTKYSSIKSYDEWKKSIDEFDNLYESYSPPPKTDLSYSNAGLNKINQDGSKDYLSYGQLIAIHNYTTPEYLRIKNFIREPNSYYLTIEDIKHTFIELTLLGNSISEFTTRSKINPITNFYLGDYCLLVEPISANEHDHNALIDLNSQMAIIGNDHFSNA